MSGNNIPPSINKLLIYFYTCSFFWQHSNCTFHNFNSNRIFYNYRFYIFFSLNPLICRFLGAFRNGPCMTKFYNTLYHTLIAYRLYSSYRKIPLFCGFFNCNIIPFSLTKKVKYFINIIGAKAPNINKNIYEHGADFSAPQFYKQYIISSLTVSSIILSCLAICSTSKSNLSSAVPSHQT